MNVKIISKPIIFGTYYCLISFIIDEGSNAQKRTTIETESDSAFALDVSTSSIMGKCDLAVQVDTF